MQTLFVNPMLIHWGANLDKIHNHDNFSFFLWLKLILDTVDMIAQIPATVHHHMLAQCLMLMISLLRLLVHFICNPSVSCRYTSYDIIFLCHCNIIFRPNAWSAICNTSLQMYLIGQIDNYYTNGVCACVTIQKQEIDRRYDTKRVLSSVH